MKTLYIEKHGGVPDLRVSDIPVPAISSGEVLVKVEASGINPSDVASVQGSTAAEGRSFSLRSSDESRFKTVCFRRGRYFR
jgi:NADPH:quinone reductase-like Zn-dependent oxidoreductase